MKSLSAVAQELLLAEAEKLICQLKFTNQLLHPDAKCQLCHLQI